MNDGQRRLTNAYFIGEQIAMGIELIHVIQSNADVLEHVALDAIRRLHVFELQDRTQLLPKLQLLRQEIERRAGNLQSRLLRRPM